MLLPLPALSAPAARIEVRLVLPGGRACVLADATRAGWSAPFLASASGSRAATRSSLRTASRNRLWIWDPVPARRPSPPPSSPRRPGLHNFRRSGAPCQPRRDPSRSGLRTRRRIANGSKTAAPHRRNPVSGPAGFCRGQASARRGRPPLEGLSDAGRGRGSRATGPGGASPAPGRASGRGRVAARLGVARRRRGVGHVRIRGPRARPSGKTGPAPSCGLPFGRGGL